MIRRYTKKLRNKQEQKWTYSLSEIGGFFFKEPGLRKVVFYIKRMIAVDIKAAVKGDIELLPDDEIKVKTLFTERTEDILWLYEGAYLYDRCLRILAIRPRSEKELYDFLVKHVDNQKSIAFIMDRLTIYIDDRAFALYLVQKERSHHPKGNSIIVYKLKEKGITDEIIAEVLHTDESATEDYIRQQFIRKQRVLEEKARRKHPDAWEREFKNLMTAHLARQGFAMKDITDYFKENL